MDNVTCFSCGNIIPNQSSWFNCKCGLNYSIDVVNVHWTDSLSPSGGLVTVPREELNMCKRLSDYLQGPLSE